MTRDNDHGDSLGRLPRAEMPPLSAFAPAPDELAAHRQQLARDVEVLAERADVPSRVLARDEPCADPASCDVHGKPTPARVPEWVKDPAKWRSMTRADRRAVERHHRKQTRGT
jgi:hypothetical protein